MPALSNVTSRAHSSLSSSSSSPPPSSSLSKSRRSKSVRRLASGSPCLSRTVSDSALLSSSFSYSSSSSSSSSLPTIVSLRSSSSRSSRRQSRSSSLRPSRSSSTSSVTMTWFGVGFCILIVSLLSAVASLMVALTDSAMTSQLSHTVFASTIAITVVAVPITHWLIGWLMHGSKSSSSSSTSTTTTTSSSSSSKSSSSSSKSNQSFDDEEDVSVGWSQFQPFRGGFNFVFLQAVGWSVFSLVLVVAGYIAMVGVKHVANWLLAVVGLGGLVSHAIVLVSLQFFVAATTNSRLRSTSNDRDSDSPPLPPLDASLAPLLPPRSLAASPPSLQQQQSPHVLSSQQEAAAAGSIVGELGQQALAEKTASTVVKAFQRDGISIIKEYQPSIYRNVLPMFGLGWPGLLCTVLSFILAMIMESQELSEVPSLSIHTLASCGLLLAVPLTHGLVAGGSWAQSRGKKQLRRVFFGRKSSLGAQSQSGTPFATPHSSQSDLFKLTSTPSSSPVVPSSDSTPTIPFIPLPRKLSASINGNSINNGSAPHTNNNENKNKLKKASSMKGRRNNAMATPTTSSLATLSRSLWEYSVFQPFVGGTTFVTLQAVAWTLWTIALLQAVIHVYHSFLYRNYVPGFFTRSGLVAVASQMLVLVSLRYFDAKLSVRICGTRPSSLSKPTVTIDRRQSSMRVQVGQSVTERELPAELLSLPDLQAKQVAQAVAEDVVTTVTTPTPPTTLTGLSYTEWKDKAQIWPHHLNELYADLQALVTVILLYSLPLLGFMVCVSPFGVGHVLYTYVGFSEFQCGVVMFLMILFYTLTYSGGPHQTGRRSWDAIRYSLPLWARFERYFSGRLIAQGQLHPNNTYVFGFHPHAIYPATCLWGTRGPMWRRAYPSIDVDICAASVVLHVPFVREVMMWIGGRDVSKRSIDHALSHGRSILLVPGGQREMRHASTDPTELRLLNSHVGFVRMAIKHGAQLVPILSFGENQMMANIRAPRLQALTTPYLGYGFPIWPYGRWYFPIPNPTPITVVVGDPVPTQQQDNPDEAYVKQIHQIYYDNLRLLFEQHKAQAGFPDCKLIYEPR